MKTLASGVTAGHEVDIRLPVVLDPRSFEVRSAPEARVGSKRTFDKITQDLEAQMGLERAALCGLQLKCRTSAGTVVPLSSGSVARQTAAAFVEDGNAIVIDLPKTTRSYISRISKLEQSHAELAQSHAELAQSHAELARTVEDMKRDNESTMKDFEDRLVVLEEDSKWYRDVIKRHIVSEVHECLQRKFGDKDEGKPWDEYLASTFAQNTSWFKRHGLQLKDICLMEKGGDTPFQQGNKAAHQPPPATIKQHVEALSSEDPAWTSWWKLVQGARRKSRPMSKE